MTKLLGGMLGADAAPAPTAAGVVLVREGGEVFLMQRADDGTWAFPGGMTEADETTAGAAQRELLEETGLDLPLAALGYLTTSFRDGEPSFFAYLASSPDRTWEPGMCPEHTACGWFPLTALPCPLHPGNEDIIEAIGRVPHAADAMLAMDRASVRTIDKDGRLHISRTPISKANVCPYYGKEIPNNTALGLQPDKVYYLLRDPEELAKAASTFNNIQLLIDHLRLNAYDTKKLETVGCTGSACEYEHPYLYNSVAVWDASAIAGIETGDQAQLSSSYHYVADMTPGMFEGVPYDGRMTNIVGNHVALVTVGRAGADVCVGDSYPVELTTMKTNPKAVAARAALGAYLRPALAMDAAPIPFQNLIKATAADTAKATAAHYKGTLEVDAKALSGVLTLAMDEAEEEMDPRGDDSVNADEDDEEEKERKRKAADKAKDKARDKAKDKARDKAKDGEGPTDEDDDTASDKATVNIADITARVRREAKELREAENAVRPIVGDVVAMDSAEEVYRFALDQAGVTHKGVHVSALPALVEMAKARSTPTLARDSAVTSTTAAGEFAKKYPNASKPTRA